jgi:hypothetical protein
MPNWGGNAPIAFSPSNVDGLIAWYDVGTAVNNISGDLQIWNDKTRYSNTLFPTGPINNFDFSGNYCYNTNIPELKYPNTGATIFTIWDLSGVLDLSSKSIQTLTSIFTDSLTNPGNGNANFSVGFGTTSLNTFQLYASYLTDISNVIMSNSDLSNVNINDYPGINIINAICFNQTNLDLPGVYSTVYLNGLCIGSNTVNPIILTNDPSYFNIFIGDSNYIDNNGITHSGSSYIYETLIYNRVLSPAQISQVNQYLAAKNGTAALANGGNFSY